MEHLLYKNVFEKVTQIKSANNLGELANFIAEIISENYRHLNRDAISGRTIKRGFRQYLPSEILEEFKWAKKDRGSNIKPYIPDLNTLNLLSEYLGYAGFSDFVKHNTPQETADASEGSAAGKKTKRNVTVIQNGDGSISYGEINAEGGITFNL